MAIIFKLLEWLGQRTGSRSFLLACFLFCFILFVCFFVCLFLFIFTVLFCLFTSYKIWSFGLNSFYDSFASLTV